MLVGGCGAGGGGGVTGVRAWLLKLRAFCLQRVLFNLLLSQFIDSTKNCKDNDDDGDGKVYVDILGETTLQQRQKQNKDSSNRSVTSLMTPK